jgi:PAS domain S-box-containing protein
MNWKLDTLRTWIGLLAALAIIPVAGVSVWTLQRDAQRATEQAYGQAQLLAEGVAHTLQWEIQGARTTLESLSTLDDVRALDPARCERLFADFARLMPKFVGVTLRRRDGSLVCSTVPQPLNPEALLASPWFAEALAGEGFSAGDAFYGKGPRRWASTLTMPVRDKAGTSAGILILPLTLDTLAQRLFERVPPQSLVVVVGRDLKVLLRSQQHAERVGQPVPERFADLYRRPETAFNFEQTGLDGQRRFYATLTMPGTGWRVVGGWPAEEILAPMRAEVRWAALWIGVVILASMMLGGFLLRRTVRPLRVVGRTLEAVTSGDVSARAVASGPRELRALTELLNKTLQARQDAETALTGSEARFRALTQLSSDWYWEQDAAFRYVQMSDGVNQFGQFDGSQHLGHTRWDLPNVDMSDEVWAAHRAQLERHEPFRNFEVRRPGRDGQTHYTLDSGIPVFDDAGRFAGYRGVGRDVTQVRRAQEALALRERGYRRLLEQLPAGVVVHAADTSIELCNAEACRVLAMTPEQMAGRQAQDPAWHLVDEAGQRLTLAEYPVMRVLSTRQPLGGTVIGVQAHAGSEVIWALVRGFPEDGADGQVARAVIVFIDITAQRQAQALQVARDRAEAADRAKTSMLSRMSHELRTPLNAVMGFSQLLAGNPAVTDSAQAQQQLGFVTRAAEQLLAMVNDLLDLGRVQSGAVRIETRPVLMWPVLEDCVATHRAAASAAGLRVDMHPQEPGIAASADPTRLMQVVSNLLSNAIKYNRPGGRIELSLQASAEQVWLHVKDSGQGLDASQLAALFVPFQRLGAEQRGIAGTGLGLVISRDLTRAMGGELAASSVPGEGSTFTVSLKRTAPPQHREPLPEVTATSALPAKPAAARALRVLYIEDNEVNLELMRCVLGDRADLAYEDVNTGQAGLERALAAPHDLLLVDIGLPDIDGVELVKRLRALPSMASTRMVAVSASAIPSDIQRARDAGFDDYLTKPFRAPDLLAIIAQSAERLTAV